MAVLANRARMVSSSAGTGSLVSSVAAVGHQSWVTAGVTSGQQVRYAAETDDRLEWEVGRGTVTISGGQVTLARDTVYASSDEGTKVEFSSLPEFWVDATAQDFNEPVANIEHYGAISEDSSSAQRTRNTAAIIAAWTAHRDIYVPEGTFYCDSIDAPANSRSIRGASNSTSILTGDPAAASPAANNFLIRRTHASPFWMRDLGVEVEVDGVSTAKGVKIYNATGGGVFNCRLSGYWALAAGGGNVGGAGPVSNFTIEGNEIDAYLGYGIISSGSNLRITKNRVAPALDAAGGAVGIAVLTAASISDVFVSENFVDKPPIFGIQIVASGSFAIKGVTVLGNRVKGNIFEAINLNASTGTIKDFTVGGNVCTFDDYGVSNDFGMDFVTSTGGTLSGGTIFGNLVKESQGTGLLVLNQAGTIEELTITGNVILRCGGGGSNTAERNCIRLTTVDSAIVTGNYLDASSGSAEYALSTFHAGSNSIVIEGNHGIAGSTGFYHIADSSVLTVDENRHLALRSYAVSGLPSAAVAARMIYVSNGTGNKRLAVSDGTNWRFPDGNVVS